MNNNQGFGIILGICIGVLFTLGFIALDYNTFVSILLGILGGIAGGFLIIWGNTEAIAEKKFLLEEDDLLGENFATNHPDNLLKQSENNQEDTAETEGKTGSIPPFSRQKDISLWHWLFKNNQRRL